MVTQLIRDTVFLVKSLPFNGAVLQNAYAQSFSPLDREFLCDHKSLDFSQSHIASGK